MPDSKTPVRWRIAFMIGLLGKKLTMTRVFDEQGRTVPVTIIEAGPCHVTQVKTPETDGYHAVQLGFGSKSEKQFGRPLLGHLKKTDAPPVAVLREFRQAHATEIKPGDKVTVEQFAVGDIVHVTGITKGRGFQGVMKRHGFKGHRNSRGTHESFRGPGSIGAHTDPGRVFSGKRMAGHMGVDRNTVRNLKVIKVDPEKNLLLVKGPIPGANNGWLEIRKQSRNPKAIA
jgi:large subunit ribosomal protein L3